ncbi:MAG: WD40 repeat domain-containing protein, partial [Chloroflexota bacterium]
DFYDQGLQHPELGRLLHQQAEVALPLSPQELEEAITAPAQRLGVTFEPGLITTIISDVNQQPGSLPLLQYALTELFDQQVQRQLMLDAYQTIGGVSGALTRRTDELYQLFDAPMKEATRQLFLRLVTLGEGTGDTRRRVSQAELTTLVTTELLQEQSPPIETLRHEAMETIINTFGQYRLLTLDQNPITHQATIEVAHEALLHRWPQANQWLETNREDIRQHRRLLALATEWQQANQDESFLVTASRLDTLEQWVTTTTLRLTELETRYFQASLAKRQEEETQEAARQAHEAALERRSRDRLRSLVIVLCVATVVALGLTAIAFYQRQEAQDARDLAEHQAQLETSARLAAQSRNLLESQYDLALLLSLEAYRIEDTTATRSSLLEAILAYPRVINYLQGANSGSNRLSYSPTGDRLASAGVAEITLWDTTTYEPIGQPLERHEGPIWDLAFSPDGQYLVSVGLDGNIIIWNLSAPEIRFEEILSEEPDEIIAVEFSPDGQYLITAGADSVVNVWSWETRQLVMTFAEIHTAPIADLDFTPDGQILASTSLDGTIILWDMATGQPLGEPLTEHTDEVDRILFTPDGKRFASTSFDGTIILWDVATRQPLGDPLRGHTGDEILGLTFSPDGQLMASGGNDSNILLWDIEAAIETGQPLDILQGHSLSVWGLVFSPDGQTLVSGSLDSSVILWDISDLENPPIRLGQPLIDSEAVIDYIDEMIWGELSNDGSKLALGGENGLIYTADLHLSTESPQFIPTDIQLAGHPEPIEALTFSPNKKTLATGDTLGNLSLWDLDDGQELPLAGHTDTILSLTFSPDGQRLASGGWDSDVMLWDAQTGEQLGSPLTEHSGIIYGLAFSPNGQTLVSGADDWLMTFWEVGDQLLPPASVDYHQVLGHESPILNVAFAPNGQLLASAGHDFTIRLWDASSYEVADLPLLGHTDHVFALAFDPNGHYLASGDTLGQVILWDLATRQPLTNQFQGHTDAIIDMAFLPDQEGMIVLSGDTQAILWDLSLDSWQEQACQIVGRNLTEAEWEQYLGDAPYRTTCIELKE